MTTSCSYYRRFIKEFAAIARPMHKLIEKNCPFNWTEECETAFQKLKITLITAPVLGLAMLMNHDLFGLYIVYHIGSDENA
jgi:hypothetical protein